MQIMSPPPPAPQSQTSGLFRPEDLVEPPRSQRHTYLVAPLFNRVVNQAWEAGTRLVYCVCSRRKLRRSTLREQKPESERISLRVICDHRISDFSYRLCRQIDLLQAELLPIIGACMWGAYLFCDRATCVAQESMQL